MYCVFLFVIFFSVVSQGSTPLDDFIAAPDPWYSYSDTGLKYELPEFNAYFLNMTSQQWLNSSHVNKPIWNHWLLVIVPTTVKYTDFAFVITTLSSTTRTPTFGEPEFDRAIFFAIHIEAIVAVLYDVPNSPLVFTADPLKKNRTGEEIIAFGWKMFGTYNSSDNYRYNWLPHFPMAKAHVKAMDAVASWTYSKFQHNITRFGISGNSARGWSTWLTAAVDTRVVLFIPIASNMIHIHPNLHHMWRSYGGWSWPLQPFYEENITMNLDSEWLQQLFEACDPYYFFDRYDGIQKLIIDGVNDAVSMLDSTFNWWSELPEPKYLSMVPEAAHTLLYSAYAVRPNIATFLASYLKKITIPKIRWNINNVTGEIVLTYNGNVSNIINAHKWYGRSCGKERRDFRFFNYGEGCCGIPLEPVCENLESTFLFENATSIYINDTVQNFIAPSPSTPTDHWVGFYILLRVKLFNQTNSTYYESPPSFGHLFFGSEVSIIPQDYPFGNCNGNNCYGTLV